MATPKYRQDLYQTRRENMKKHLKHGDIKILAEKIITHFPEVTQSNLRDYANYLSQVFNPRSGRSFKDELARNIEEVWEGFEYGDLDSFNTAQEHQYTKKTEFEDFVTDDKIVADKNHAAEQQGNLMSGYKKDSVLPAIFLDALKWRIHEKYPDADTLTNEILRFEKGDYVADLVVTNNSTTTPLLIVETGKNSGALQRMRKISYLDFLLSESGAKRGLLALLNGDEINENWLQNKNI
jgi:hypothetical protein